MKNYLLCGVGLLAGLSGAEQDFYGTQKRALLEGFGNIQFTQFAGYVQVDLMWDYTGVGDCPSDHYLYHIHEIWNHTEVTSATLDMCAYPYTGPHWDPKGCGNGPRPSYSCSGGPDGIYTCEVGDMSSRFGPLELPIGMLSFDDYVLTIQSLENRSVAVHCGDDGSYLSCGKIVAHQGPDPTAYDMVHSSGAPLLKATPTTDDGVKIGEVLVGGKAGHLSASLLRSGLDRLKNTSAVNPTAGFEQCVGAVTVRLHQKWEHGQSKNLAFGTECGVNFTGGHWDPLYACGPNSMAKDDSICDCVHDYPVLNEMGMPDTLMNPHTACAAGDLSCRYRGMSIPNPNGASPPRLYSNSGTFNMTAEAAVEYIYQGQGFLPTAPGVSVVYSCAADGEPLLCARLDQTMDYDIPLVDQNADYTRGAFSLSNGADFLLYTDDCTTLAQAKVSLQACQTFTYPCTGTTYSAMQSASNQISLYASEDCSGTSVNDIDSTVGGENSGKCLPFICTAGDDITPPVPPTPSPQSDASVIVPTFAAVLALLA